MAEDFPSELSSVLGATDANAREAAWSAFLSAYSRLLLHVARQVGRDYDAAMDAYTHIVEQLHAGDCRRLRGYAADGRSKFTTWLVVVARRLCVDYLRHRYGRARDNGDVEGASRVGRRRLEDLLAEQVDVADLPDDAAGPEAELIASEQSRVLAAGLAGLAPRDRLLLRLRFEDDLSAREIATLVGYPTPFHVYRRLKALLVSLRSRLALRDRQEAGLPPFNRANEQ
ncbi:MAG TPA: sigma-70 family RNA polymerase sigma factor [Candidatus Dormibacteraeota bacterium]|jgi:RNA polymerase sigma factor (sigma-70 family)